MTTHTSYTIGFIGVGRIGTQVAKAVIKAGHPVVISNSRGPETLADVVQELGSQARAATAAEAAVAGEVVVIAVPLSGITQLPVEQLANKVVIATTNYNPPRDGHIAELDAGSATVAGMVQAQIPRSHVVRAFSHISSMEVTTDGTPEGTPNRRALAIAGDDVDAKRMVAALYNQVGFDSVDIGGLDESWRVDRGQPAFIVRQNADELRANVARATRYPAS
jgi:8-hydroxy-5-deazaflavin:NADPH oxidoreductase